MPTINEQITRFRNALVADPNAARPNSRQMLTLLRDALVAELANENTGTGTEHPDWNSDIRIVSCVIRKGTGDQNWRLIDDSSHAAINVSSVTNNASLITINYAVTFSEVITCMAVADEAFAGVYEFGTSGQLGNATIAVVKRDQFPVWGGALSYNGTTWSFAQRFGNSTPVVSGGTTKTIDITHTNDDCGVHMPIFTQTYDGPPPYARATSISATATRVFIPASYTPQPGDNILIQRQRTSALAAINPANITSDAGNIWFFAIGIV